MRRSIIEALRRKTAGELFLIHIRIKGVLEEAHERPPAVQAVHAIRQI